MLSPPARRRCCVQRSRRLCTSRHCRLRTPRPLGSCGFLARHTRIPHRRHTTPRPQHAAIPGDRRPPRTEAQVFQPKEVAMSEPLDEIDRVIARELVADGRATLAHLAAAAGLSVSAVQSRVRTARVPRCGDRVLGPDQPRSRREACCRRSWPSLLSIPLNPMMLLRGSNTYRSHRVVSLGGRRGELRPAGACRVPAGARRLAATDPDGGECPHPKHHHLTNFLRSDATQCRNCYGQIAIRP